MNETASIRTFSDAPLGNSKEDRFRRASFAKAIAQTLSSLPDKTSIVVGIYGPWGDGKSSVLSFIKEALKSDRHIVVMDFNPWRFGKEDELLRSFFDSLVTTVGQSLADAIDLEFKTACSYAAASAWVCSELAAGPSGSPQTGESGSVLNWR